MRRTDQKVLPVASGFNEVATQAASIPAVVLSLTLAGLVYVFAQRWWNSVGDAFRIVPIFYVLVVLGAALCVVLLTTRARLIGDVRAGWVATGIAIAGVAALGQASVIMRLQNAPLELSSDGLALLYLIWHAALAVFAAGAILIPGARRLRWALAGIFALAIVAAFADIRWDFLPRLVDERESFTPLYASIRNGLLLTTLTTVGVWWYGCGRGPSRPEVWIGVCLLLATLDLAVASGAEQLFESIWWSSAALRAAQFSVPAVGLLADALRLMGRLHLHERSLTELLRHERGLALRRLENAEFDTQDAHAIQQVIDQQQFTTVFQPIYSLRTGEVSALEALTRFTGEPVRPPDQWFAAAERCGLGTELELATLSAALQVGADRPAGVALSVNLSPAAVSDPRLDHLLDRSDPGLIVELTEHAIVEDYPALLAALERLRKRGILIAIDDAGSGFASLQHIVQLGPDIIKLDMSLTRGIHLDPVRRALATSLIDFARQTDSELIAEGVETADELETLKDIGAHAVQGYLLARPGPLAQAVDTPRSERTSALLAHTNPPVHPRTNERRRPFSFSAHQ